MKVHPGIAGRLAVLALAVIIAGMLVSARDATADGCATAGPACRTTWPTYDPAQTSAEQALAEKYRPVVFTKQQAEPCDSAGEAYYPVAVETVLGNPATSLFDDGSLVKTAPTAADLYRKDAGYYLDYPGDPEKPGCGYEEDFKAITPQPDPVVYARFAHEARSPQLVLQYWFYFYFNDWNNSHEGDWEFIQLVFRENTAEEALASAPSKVIYSQHGGGETADWTSGKLLKDGDRPEVFVAKGSHANQYQPENHLGKGEHGTGFGCDDARGPSVRFDPEARVIPSEVSGPDDPYAWITYLGQWGQRAKGEFDGPTGPNDKKPWTQPISWMNEQRDSSVTVPENSIGPNAAGAFCKVVAWGSKLLFDGGPYLVLGLLVGLAGAIGITANNTRFRPVIASPLRARRQFGQILRAAFRFERDHWTLFFAIGALFVPLGIIATGVQTLVLDWDPVQDVSSVVDYPAFDAAVALALGALQFGIAYWLVIAATIAALKEMDGGRVPGPAEPYRTVARKFGDLFVARIVTVGIIVLLSITLIGIPVAIVLGVRWLFIEQEILLDGSSRAEARSRSWDLVKGRGPRTLGISAAIALTGIFAGPAIGMTLVLLTSTSLIFVNALSSLLYLALVPYVGIGLTLLYFDLQLTRTDTPE